MAGNSKIEWTEQTWNVIVGCSIVSPGCTNCYAMRQAPRTDAMSVGCPVAGTFSPKLTKSTKAGPVWTGQLRFVERRLLDPLKRKKPTTYFVNSMGDLFHEDCPDQWIDKVFAVMRDSPQHTFQVLTKRAERMRDYVTNRFNYEAGRAADNQILDPYPVPILPNLWLGVSTERQQEADERIPLLLQTPAAVRFISAEPLLGPIDLTRVAWTEKYLGVDAVRGRIFGAGTSIQHTKLDWVIAGGESGTSARPMHPDWARSLRDQCKAASVPFFFKQWGEWLPCAGDEQRAFSRELRSNPDNHESAWPDGTVGNGHWDRNGGFGYPLLRVGKKAAGRLLEGIEHNAMPVRP